MKLRLIAAALVALPTLAACASSSADQARRAEAWSRCRTAPNPETRDRCIETEIALLEARESQEAASRAERDRLAEERQARLEAQGISREDARQTTESGLQVPRD
ncbi:MAG: hypothetical protein R3265_07110 [Hyphomonas sp.]|nr:hypothetical protein [Hyphomonas sp.]